MGKTKIAWCDFSFNGWVGCTKVGPGCDHCYAESWAKRIGQPGLWEGERRRTSESNWRQPLQWAGEAKRLEVRYRVFSASLADVFDNEVPDEWRRDLFDLIRATPNLDWLILTKRIGNAMKMLPDDWGRGWPNVWMGATMVNQEEVDRDLIKLLRVPAKVRWLSIEPQLGPIEPEDVCWVQCVSTREEHDRDHDGGMWCDERSVDWIVVGGESGAHARPFALEWARAMRDECQKAGVAFFMKQMGTRWARDGGLTWRDQHAYRWNRDRAGADPVEWPKDMRVREWPR